LRLGVKDSDQRILEELVVVFKESRSLGGLGPMTPFERTLAVVLQARRVGQAAQLLLLQLSLGEEARRKCSEALHVLGVHEGSSGHAVQRRRHDE
jgi:hypothetical protein